MASQTTVFLCVFIITLISIVYSFMDIEELQSINYGINIVKEPILVPETYSDTAILVTSRHGQQYQCSYPTHQEQKQQKEEEEKIALETGVVELLKPMAQQPCLLKVKEWWTYEICYGKHVRQYHFEDGQIRGNVMYLGHFQSDFDWKNETLKDSRLKSKIASGRYHSQYYTNGSKCDLTGNGRETEVRYVCEDTEADYIVRVDEPETCVYVIIVHTPRICRHPHLKSPTPTQPIPIVCAPVLTDQQFSQYQAHMEAQRRKEEAARVKAKAEQEQREKARVEAEAQEEDRNIEGGLTDSVNTILKKSLGKEMKTVDSGSDMSSSGVKDSVTVGWKVVKDLEDIQKLLVPQGIFGNHRKESRDTPAQSAPEEETTQQSVNDKLEDFLKQMKQDNSQEGKQTPADDDDFDSDIEAAIESELTEFEKEVKQLRDKQAMTQKRLEQIKDKVRKTVTSQFQDIIEEAEAEVGGEVDEAQAFKQLASSLNMLLDKLEHTGKEIKNMDQELAKLGEKEGLSASTTTGAEERENEEEEEEEVLAEEEEQVEKEKEGQKEKGGVQAPPTTRQASKQSSDSGGRWKMRVRTLTQEEIDKGGPAHLPPSKQREHLEHSLKESLEKVGVDPSSVKVHVKIIGASTSDQDDDGTLHVLSEEDSASFQNMIVALLGGSNEAVKEKKRHDTLEDGYNFVFSQAVPLDSVDSQSDSTSPSAGSDNSSDRHDDDSDSLHDVVEKEL